MCNSQPRSSSNGDNSREGGDNQHWQGLYPDISEMFSNMDTSNSNSNDPSQGRSPGQVPPIMLLLQQLLGLPQDQQPGAGSNQDAPSAPGHQHQQTPSPPPSSTGHPHQQTPPPPHQQNQFCSNCSGSRGRQDDCR